jgi:hypothetical protein
MTKMADRIKKSNQAVTPNDATREQASEKEHSKSTPPTSYRLPPEILAQIEALRIAQGQQTGRVPTATDVIKGLVSEAHHKVNK